MKTKEFDINNNPILCSSHRMEILEAAKDKLFMLVDEFAQQEAISDEDIHNLKAELYSAYVKIKAKEFLAIKFAPLQKEIGKLSHKCSIGYLTGEDNFRTSPQSSISREIFYINKLKHEITYDSK